LTAIRLKRYRGAKAPTRRADPSAWRLLRRDLGFQKEGICAEITWTLSVRLRAATVALSFTAFAARADDITIGFVTHAQGNPFVEQIVDGAKAAAADLGVTLKVQESPGGSPEGQLKLAQGLVNAGASGVASSMPGDAMAKGMNDIVASGVPVVQFNMLSKSIQGPYVGEKSTQSGRILGKMIVDKLGGASAKHAGTQVVKASSVDMGAGLPTVTFDQLEKLAADPKATAEFYKPWTKTVTGGASPPGAQPVEAESE
jgi:ABC-type sugar transport system substrate-binding protein